MGPNANEPEKLAINGTGVPGIVPPSWIGNSRSALGFWDLPEALRIFKACVQSDSADNVARRKILPVIILDSSARSNPAHTARSLALT